MKYIPKTFFKSLTIKDYGKFLFLSGVFFLPSTLVVGVLFLFSASIIGSFINKKSYLEEKWNYPFLIFGILIVLSAILQNFILPNIYSAVWDPKLSFIGIFNWLPFIWLFWALQPYIDTKAKRRLFSLILISGTFPVLITGFGQYFLDWTGPFETLNGLIIWYQRPVESPGGLTGLFNHQNYAGSWLNFVWPFGIALFLERKNDLYQKISAFFLLFSIGFATFLTYSRNAWIGLLTSLTILAGKRIIPIFILILIIISCIVIIVFIPISFNEIQYYLRNSLLEKILLEFSNQGYEGLDVTRLEIFSSALMLIQTSPIFGLGAASFSEIFLLETSFWKGHSHNLFLELSISYGLPATIIFFSTISMILINSGNLLFNNKNNVNSSIFDKAFWAALFFFLISQMVDIQYFDGKISIISWILISGLKNIIEDNNNKTISKNINDN